MMSILLRVLPFSVLAMGLLPTAALSQVFPTDSTYLRMRDRSTALEAIRFDMSAYNDTLRTYRDALDHSSSRVDASMPAGEDQKARLGLLRRDAQQLDKEMKRLRKRLKRSSPALEDVAITAGDLVRRTKLLRTRIAAEGVAPER